MERRAFLRNTASVATVTAMAGCSSLGILGGNEPFIVTIDYPDPWSGSVGSGDGQRSVQGSGKEQFEVEGDIVSAVAQKQDASRRRLTVLIAVGDNVVKGKYTTAQYGAVSVSHRRGGEDEVADEGNQGNDQGEQTQPEIERVAVGINQGGTSPLLLYAHVRNPNNREVEVTVEGRISMHIDSTPGQFDDGRILTDSETTSIRPSDERTVQLNYGSYEEGTIDGVDVSEIEPQGSMFTFPASNENSVYEVSGVQCDVAELPCEYEDFSVDVSATLQS